MNLYLEDWSLSLDNPQVFKKKAKTGPKPTPADLPLRIPPDPQEFYTDFGPLTHSFTGRVVPKITSYQYEVWRDGFRYKYILVVKSQKIGLTTTELMHDFQHAITDCRGYEILLIAQTADAAKEHLYTLRDMIRSSRKYAPFLISTKEEGLSQDQATKATIMFIRNPDNPLKPTRIIARGPKETGIWSWKNVKHIHISDIAIAAKQMIDYSGTINSALSRLATTQGTIIIETPPYGPSGKVYDIFMKSRLKEDGKPEGQFKIHQIPAWAAEQAGVITKEFLEAQRSNLGPAFAQYFEAEFIAVIGNLLSQNAIEKIEANGKMHTDFDSINPYTIKTMGIDPGFGDSWYAIVVLEWIDNMARVIYAKAFDMTMNEYEQIVKHSYNLYRHYKPHNIFIDGSVTQVIRTLKKYMGEPIQYEETIAEVKKTFPGAQPQDSMKVVPVHFGPDNAQRMLEKLIKVASRGQLAIDNDRFPDLMTELKIARTKGLKLEKNDINTMDLTDALRMALELYR